MFEYGVGSGNQCFTGNVQSLVECLVCAHGMGN